MEAAVVFADVVDIRALSAAALVAAIAGIVASPATPIVLPSVTFTFGLMSQPFELMQLL